MSLLDTLKMDRLIINGPVQIAETWLAAGQNLSRGAVLGKVKATVPTSGTANGGNTGTGTVTEVTGGKNTKIGTYTISCVRAVTNGGEFYVTNPDGKFIGAVLITAGASGTGVFKSDELNFTVTDGATDFALNDTFTLYWFESDHLAFVVWDGGTDFIVGDYFSISVAIADRECVIVNSSNTNGSSVPFAVLNEDCDATSAATPASVIVAGTVNERELQFGGTDTIETHRDNLRSIGILTALSTPVGAE